VSIAKGIHLASDVRTRVRGARDYSEAGARHAILNELPGAEELSFAGAGAEIMAGDAQSAGDAKGAIHSADSQRFRTLDVHLQKIDALDIFTFQQLIQTNPRDLKRALGASVYDAVRMPSLKVFDRHGSGGIEEREVHRKTF
jgi:hypothetical protein